MRRNLAIIMAFLLTILLILPACGKAGPESAPASPHVTESTAPADSPEADTADNRPAGDEDAAYQGINAYDLTFDDSVQRFLNAFGAADDTLFEIEPMLVSAAFAADTTGADFYIGDEPADADFMWNTLFYYINTYAYGEETVTQTDGTLVVPSEAMAGFLIDLFDTEDIPEIPDTLDDAVTYDEASDSYTLLAASGEGLSYVISDIAISLSDSAENDKQSAILTFDVLDIDGNVQNAVCIEIVPLADSYYFYTVSAAYPADEAE